MSENYNINKSDLRRTANFVQLNIVNVKNSLMEVLGDNLGTIELKDPWWVVNGIQPNEFRTLSSLIMSLFLNQKFDPNEPNLPYYSVRSQSPQSIYLPETGKTHKFYFQGWSAEPEGSAEFRYPDNIETPVVFKQDNAVVKANLKGTQLSNLNSAFANNSQNKFIKVDGKLYLTYESGGRIWLERSSDNGATWELLNDGKPVDIYNGKFPSLAGWDSSNESLILVYKESAYGEEIRAQKWQNGMKQFDVVVAGDLGYGVANNSAPVAAYNYNGRLFVVWDTQGYLYYRYGNVLSSNINWFNYLDYIAQSGSSSSRPSIVKDNALDFHLVWQNSYSNIEYCKIDIDTNDDEHFVNNTIISTGCGFPTNYFPNITFHAGLPTVVWIGVPYYGSNQTKVIFRKRYSGGWSSFGQYGDVILSPVVNSGDNNNYIIAWTENNGASNKFLKYGGIKTFNTSGRFIQLCNSSSLNSMFGMSFKENSEPFYFSRTNSVGSIFKENSAAEINEGRKGVISNDTLEYFFSIGDIFVNNEKLSFENCPEDVKFNSIEELSSYIRTSTFELSEETSIEYNYEIGATDSIEVIKQKNSFEVNIELFNSETNELINVVKNLKYNPGKGLIQYGSIHLNVDGYKLQNAGLRAVLSYSGSGLFNLTQILNDRKALAKSNSTVETINIEPETVVTKYSLGQNHPNPFNPSTTITYSLPQKGQVVLKIYNSLGQEVKTLVNEFKEEGIHKINFNASKLPSGVYIYSIQSNDFMQSKKMILLK